MKFGLKILWVLVILILSIGIVSASDDNSTTESLSLTDESPVLADVSNNDSALETPKFSLNSSSAYSGGSINIYLKDSNNTPLTNQNLTAKINKNTYEFITNSKGKATLKLDFKPGKYSLNLNFKGNENFTGINKTFNIKILKFNSDITAVNTTVLTGKYFYVYLKGENGDALASETVSITVNGKTYNVNTNDQGKAGLKIKLAAGKYSIKVSFKGNDYYNSISKTWNLIVPATTSLTIGNTRLLSNGYLRIYLRSDTPSAVSNKNVKITVGKKTFTKKTNSEGIIVCKPNVGTGTFNVTAKFDGDSRALGCYAEKSVKGINGNVKNPLKSKIPLKNGVPDVDLMPSYYVMADGDMTYSVTKAEYRDVLKRDSYCLFLNNKLAKYTFFKSKKEPKLKHIIKREKWNVIERALNIKIVKKNKYGYWPKHITASLKGKSYTYSEVRDEQNTGYTCGPTSCSFCSQVLRNYVNEWQLAKQAGSDPYYGSSTSGLKKALEKNHFKCSYYYKSSFDKALKQLKKGACALVFHTWSHYVSILDISKDGKKVLVGNPSGDYDHGSHGIPTNWLTVKYMKKMFNDYDTSGLIVKLKYSLNKATKKKINNFYSSMGVKWTRQNTNERIPQI